MALFFVKGTTYVMGKASWTDRLPILGNILQVAGPSFVKIKTVHDTNRRVRGAGDRLGADQGCSADQPGNSTD